MQEDLAGGASLRRQAAHHAPVAIEQLDTGGRTQRGVLCRTIGGAGALDLKAQPEGSQVTIRIPRQEMFSNVKAPVPLEIAVVSV